MDEDDIIFTMLVLHVVNAVLELQHAYCKLLLDDHILEQRRLLQSMPVDKIRPAWEMRLLFSSGTADPENQDVDHIDEIYNGLAEDNILLTIPIERFRQHYMLKAAACMSGKAVEGIRRSEFRVVCQTHLHLNLILLLSHLQFREFG